MTDLEPITTPEAYESAREMARQYEQRLAEHQRELNALEEEALALMAKNTERRKEIIANLKTGLWALEAQCHDYELNSIDCPKCNGNGAEGTGWMYDPDDWAESCPRCNGRGKVNDEEPKGSWTAEIISLRDLIQAAALNPEYEQYLQPNQVALNKAARKMKRTMYTPGVVATRKEKP